MPAYHISEDLSKMQLDVIHAFLTRSYWAHGISRDLVARSMQNSMCFGAFLEAEQVGFARVITDKATFAYLADVFVLDDHRGRGVSKLLMQTIMNHPELQGLRRWTLITRDAHRLYGQFGFQVVQHPERYMEIHRSDIYKGESP